VVCSHVEFVSCPFQSGDGWRCTTESEILCTVTVSVDRVATQKTSLRRVAKTYKDTLVKMRVSLLSGVYLVKQDPEANKNLLGLLLRRRTQSVDMKSVVATGNLATVD
jgi:hypothetical protein